MSEEDDEEKAAIPSAKPLGEPPSKTSRHGITKDLAYSVEIQEKAIELSDEIMERIRQIVGSGEDDSELTKQLERLETQFDALNQSVTEIRVSIGKIDTRLDGIEKNLVSKGQVAIWALLAGMAVFAAGWWVVQQYLAPLLASLGK
ncbi:hypothetical protein NP554_18640 [Pseudomonas asiatica]|uniref:Uncharacterized protein n=1 Tax=Pseudomonas asiatica TaxID=2219225 RepID=A0A9X4HYL0_9PSED|nr:hypothetical protein [Pseudomonas asiatica]MDD2113796.1 hypothetical protein [Pseudomonas asiatica]